MKEEYIIKKVVLFTLSLVLLSLPFLIKPESKVNAIPCASGYYCTTSRQWVNSYISIRGSGCWYTSWYTCNGDINNCVADYVDTFSDRWCINKTHDDYGCCIRIPAPTCTNCTPNSAPACPTGTITTNTGDLHTTTSSCCDRGTGCDPRYNCNTRNCYCELCTLPSCSPTYATTNQGAGSTVFSCRNGTTTTPDRTTKCDLRTVTCYCYNCTLNNCPAPLSNTETVISPNMILSGFRTCTNNCSVTRTGDCYEVPTAPTDENLVIVPDAANSYGFTSNNHSGIPLGGLVGNLNDPANMIAEYTDANGVADIEALFVWFRRDTYTGEPGTPLWISTTATPKAPAADSWGFMMHREGGTWYPYVPSYPASGTATWTRINTYDPNLRTFYIYGTDSLPMVSVTITGNGITEDSVTKKVTMPFSLRFSGSDLRSASPVSKVTYKLLLMGLDNFSYTPNDNYPFSVASYWQSNQLRYRTTPTVAQTYARGWTDTLKTWTLDKQRPNIGTYSITTDTVNGRIIVTWGNVTDEKRLYAVVGNIYYLPSDDQFPVPVTLSTSTAGVTFPSSTSYTPTIQTSADVPGHLVTNRAFMIGPNMGGTTNSGSVFINPGGNREGSLVIYLTVFDYAGNVYSVYNTYSLKDWFVTDGGLAYSENGTTFQTENIVGDTWGTTLPPFARIAGESLISNIADYSSEMWADSNPVQPPSALLRSSVSGSYNIRNFKSHNLTSYYDTLLEMYTKKKQDIPASDLKELLIEGDVTVANANLTAIFTPMSKYNVAIITGKLIINGLNCNGYALIFVNGDIDVLPNITNQTANRNACIFVSRGNINIKEGRYNSNGGTFRYDQINGYFIADGNIIIEHETGAIVDGVYINGGIQSLGNPKGIIINRYLRFYDRLRYPVLAIDYHPKYGFISGIFFANNFTFQKVEVGLKP